MPNHTYYVVLTLCGVCGVLGALLAGLAWVCLNNFAWFNKRITNLEVAETNRRERERGEVQRPAGPAAGQPSTGAKHQTT